MSVIIRLLRPADSPDVAACCFPELSQDDVAERVQEDLALQGKGEGFTLVAEVDGRVGVTAKMVKCGRVGWIFNVAAHPDFRGRGVVQKLLERLAKRARRMGTERLAIHVRADNAAARRAYEKAGFHHVAQDGMRGEQLRYERRLGN